MIPDFQSIMLPLLNSFKGNEIKSAKELRLNMVNHFNMTEEELKEKIPSGKQFTYSNRIAWAISYLKMAELIFLPKVPDCSRYFPCSGCSYDRYKNKGCRPYKKTRKRDQITQQL